MSSSLPLTFTYLHYPHHKPSSYLKTNLFSPSKFTPKPHICFTFGKNSSDYEREEQRWLREEQRWLREEQRWLREQERWEDEKEVLLNEIQNLKNEIESLRSGGVGNGNVENVVKLLNVLKKEVSQIAESGSSGVPFVVEANAEDVEHVEVVKEVVDEVEKVVKEVEVKEVEVKEVKEVKVNVDKKRIVMLRVGSEGDQVQMLQEALLKLGFYCGEEDEEFSSFASGTERAVKTWQSSIGVPETGVMTVELLERLFVESGFKEIANGAAATSVTEVPEIPQDPKAYVSDDRVFLLGENRYEDSSRLKNRNSQTQTSSKGVVTTKCITCRGEGRLLCLECDGTGEPNIEPQFLEWVGEDTKCPYCEGHGHINCDACQGTGVGAA